MDHFSPVHRSTPASAVVALFSQCFAGFCYRSWNPWSPSVTSSTLLCCSGMVFQVTFISHILFLVSCLTLEIAQLPGSFLSRAWRWMSLQTVRASHGFHLECASHAQQQMPPRLARMGTLGCPLLFIQFTPITKAQLLQTLLSSLGLLSLSSPHPPEPFEPTLCIICQLKDQSVEVPLFPLPPIQISDTLGLKHTQCTVNHS